MPKANDIKRVFVFETEYSNISLQPYSSQLSDVPCYPVASLSNSCSLIELNLATLGHLHSVHDFNE